MIDRQLLMKLRSIVIQLLNALDDTLQLPRTIPDKSTRRQIRRNMLE